ncbi:interleukin-18 receptor accessory protein-like [Symphorus nematophorus]
MQTGFILVFFIFPVFLDGCCVGNHQFSSVQGLQQDTINKHYRVVEGEIFMMPCLRLVNMEVVWSRSDEGSGGNERPSFDCGRKILAEAKHSGNYTCLKCGSKLSFHLQVVERNSVGCLQPNESSVYLLVGAGGTVDCPGLNCSDNTDIIWYKGKRAVSEERRPSCEENGQLHLCQVKEQDDNVFFCDRQIIEQGVEWTFRRAVNVTVVLVRWYMHYGGNMENRTPIHNETQKWEGSPLDGFMVTQQAIIEEVTPQHLNNTYTCIASNTVGNHNVTIKLKKKIKVTWPSLAGYPIVSLLLVAGMGIVLRVKWLELQLIYRSYFQHGKQDGDEKEFDVFLSYVLSAPSADMGGVMTFSSRSGSDADKEASLSSKDPLNSEEGTATQQPLGVLLPQVLEKQWGYRLCLLERDSLPGGVYTNDVVLTIQRSRMLICLLSADYLSSSNAVFVLESGVQALLQNSTFKLLLIWTNRASASLVQPDPPLPTLVQRALKVLPSLEWTSGKPARATSNFWKSLRKAMPDHRVRPVSFT